MSTSEIAILPLVDFISFISTLLAIEQILHLQLLICHSLKEEVFPLHFRFRLLGLAHFQFRSWDHKSIFF